MTKEWLNEKLKKMKEIAIEVAEEIRKREGVLGIISMGSVAFGKITEYSDVDMEVIVTPEYLNRHPNNEIKKYKTDYGVIELDVYFYTFEDLMKEFGKRESIEKWESLRYYFINGWVLYDASGILKSLQDYWRKYPRHEREINLKKVKDAIHNLMYEAECLLDREKPRLAIVKYRLAILHSLLAYFTLNGRYFPGWKYFSEEIPEPIMTAFIELWDLKKIEKEYAKEYLKNVKSFVNKLLKIDGTEVT